MNRYLTLTYVLLMGLTACGSNAGPAPSASPTPETVTATCATDSRVTPYTDNMTVKGKAYSVQFVTADPSAPAVGANTWTFKVLDAQGAAVNNATVTVVPWMPDHGHGPSVQPTVTNAGGVYTVKGVELFMPGVWQLTFNIVVDSAKDSGVVDFCVAG